MTHPIRITIWWDAEDKTNEHWRERVGWADGRVDEGLHEGLNPAERPNTTRLQEAVVALAWHHGLDLEDGDVTVDGLTADWLTTD